MALVAENVLNSPQKRWDRIRERSNTRGVNCESAELDGISDYTFTCTYTHFTYTHLHLFIYV